MLPDTMQNEIAFNGCAPVPLAHYLKALGILRLVAEQLDASVAAFWRRDTFRLICTEGAETLERFFLSRYRPTPVLAPWNGGSGFYKKDQREAIEAIRTSKAERFAPYRDSLERAQRLVESLQLTEKPAGEAKDKLLRLCRNKLPEQALDWLDAVFVVGEEGAKFPPLLGTGGNDGRLEFTNNFMQRLVELFDPASGDPTALARRCLRYALFADPGPGSASKAPVGQFLPGSAGGANATSGFDAASAVNPWDYVLMIEGTLLFAATSVKKLESGTSGQMIYPFCVRQAGVGYGSAAPADETNARCEMWMPLWNRPTTLPELRTVFGEGRAQVHGRPAGSGIAQVHGRPARNGVDFARAAVTLGVDRGISAFQRYGFQVRNGLSYFATPLERVRVRRNARADLLAEVDRWIDRLRAKAGPQANPPAPASVSRALNQLEARILDFCKNDTAEHVQGVLTALGYAERALARSLRWANSDEVRLQPLGGLSSRWLDQAKTDRAEFRLARTLAGTYQRVENRKLLPLRQHLEPVKIDPKPGWEQVSWLDQVNNDVVWRGGDFAAVCNAILARRIVQAVRSRHHDWPDETLFPARLDDITLFIEGRTDDSLIADLLWGFSLINWSARELAASDEPGENSARVAPSALYALLRLSFRKGVPFVPAVHRRAMYRDGAAASEIAARRLQASGFAPCVARIPLEHDVVSRTAAALLFPIHSGDFYPLEVALHRPRKHEI